MKVSVAASRLDLCLFNGLLMYFQAPNTVLIACTEMHRQEEVGGYDAGGTKVSDSWATE